MNAAGSGYRRWVSSPRTSGSAAGDGGFATMGFVVAVGFSMLFFVLMANLLVVQYGRGAVRVALDEGARHGARFEMQGSQCEGMVRTVLGGLLGGGMSSGVSFQCAKGSRRTEARAQVVFPAWLPWVADYRFEMSATAATERK